jgi:hypothetical protein
MSPDKKKYYNIIIIIIFFFIYIYLELQFHVSRHIDTVEGGRQVGCLDPQLQLFGLGFRV